MSNKYPEFFFSFSGSTKESVKSIGNNASGWSGKDLVRTRLLDNLEVLAGRIRSGEITAPVCIFLVGGPGNGKTEAAEFFIKELYGTIPATKSKSAGRLIFSRAVSKGVEGVVVVEDATELPKGMFKSDIVEFALRSKSFSHFPVPRNGYNRSRPYT